MSDAAGSDEPSPRADGPRELGASFALFVAALLPRLYVALAWAREPVWDGHYYDFGARRIAAGLGYSDDVVVNGHPVWHPWCHYPVGYSALLGAVYRVFGAGPHVATVTGAILGALTAALVHRLALRVTTPRRAIVAGALMALSPGLVAYAALVMTEPVAALGLVLAGWLVARDRDRHPLRGAALGGFVMGLTTLVRPQSLVCAPALGLLLLGGEGAASWRQTWRGAVRAGAVATVAAVLTVAPWTARNCRVMDGCALVSTNGGWNLAIGAFPRATGRFETLRASDGCRVVTGQVQQDRCWLEAGLRWIREDPGRWLGLMPKKLAETFDHESFPMGYLGEADPASWPEARKAKGRDLLSAAHRWLLVLAALGFIASPVAVLRQKDDEKRRRWIGFAAQAAALLLVAGLALFGFTSDEHVYWPIAIVICALAALPLPGAPARGGAIAYAGYLVFSVCVTHAVFFGEDRYHVVLTPFFALLAACALRRGARGEVAAG